VLLFSIRNARDVSVNMASENLFPDSHQSEEYAAILKKDEKVCPKCFLVLPKSGKCDNCES
jgi:hypothetical protein